MALGVKNLPANTGDARDVGLIPGSGRSLGVGNGNSLQYSCLENFMARRVWWATKSWIQTEMQRVDSLEKTLMLGGIGGRRRRG